MPLELAGDGLLVAPEDEGERLRELSEDVRLEVHRQGHAVFFCFGDEIDGNRHGGRENCYGIFEKNRDDKVKL